MNHSVAYQNFSESIPTQDDYDVYKNIIAAISDINLTLPAVRELTTEVVAFDAYSVLQIKQNETIVHAYFLRKTPGLFSRALMQITLGFVSHEKVETIKTEIESRYSYGERIIN